jgi:signal transduction histidine kinase
MALSETNRMSDLVQQLRDTYRPSKENQAVQLDVTEVLEKVRALLSPQLRQNNITWISLTQAKNTIIKGKPDQLKQVFLNICLNGIDAMGNKGGTLTVTVSQHIDQNKLCVSFRDTGPGISKRNLNQIFEPFFTTKQKGTGLGLAISYEIVKEHNGEITVESRSGKGATFKVWLPIEV